LAGNGQTSRVWKGDFNEEICLKNSFSLSSQISENSTAYLSGSGKLLFKNFSFLGNASYDSSDGFHWLENGERKLRGNSDYKKMNFTGKMFYYPGTQSEILAEVSYLKSYRSLRWL